MLNHWKSWTSVFCRLFWRMLWAFWRLPRAAFQRVGNQQYCKMSHRALATGIVNSARCSEAFEVLIGNAALSREAKN